LWAPAVHTLGTGRLTIPREPEREHLNIQGPAADDRCMTIAPNDTPQPVGTLPAWVDEAAAAGVTGLLPPRAAVLDRLAEQLPAADAWPTSLLIVGLLRPDDTWPTSAETLTAVTTLLARSLRGDDWLGSTGPSEFAVHLAGPVSAAQTAATRLLGGIARLDVPGLSAAAGIAALGSEVSAAEVLRRATLCLTTARTIGPAQVITYSGTR
jgi:hypothetical protein